MQQKLTFVDKGESVEIVLYGQIGSDCFGDGVSARDFRAEVKKAGGRPIDLRVNSPGGSVFEGSAMKAALDEYTGRITAHVDGVAASAASFLIMGAKTIRVASNALVMIHNPHTFAMGGAAELRKIADTLDKVQGQIVDAYHGRAQAKSSREQLLAWMDAETWFTGQEAVDAGLADEATAALPVAAMASMWPIMQRWGFKLPAQPTPVIDAATVRCRDRLRTIFP